MHDGRSVLCVYVLCAFLFCISWTAAQEGKAVRQKETKQTETKEKAASKEQKKIPTREALEKEIEDLRKKYDQRLSDLELTIELMEAGGGAGELDAQGGRPGTETVSGEGFGMAPGRIGTLGQEDRFSRTFNPAIGLVLDMVGTLATDKKSRGHQDSFWLRAAELNLSAHIDPYGYGYAVFEGTEDEGVHVVEAAGVLNRLPANFSLKGGRMLADVTKFGQRHDHELPFVEKPQVLFDYVGGSLQGTGLEVHQWFGITDTIPLRWSLGAFTGLEGHSHDIVHGHHHHHDEYEEGGLTKRHLNNFGYGGRVTSYMDLNEKDSLQVGLSGWWSPEVKNRDETGTYDTRRAVGALDVTYKWEDPSSRKQFIMGAEGLLSHGEFLYGEGTGACVDSETSTGGYLWGEYAWNPYWSVGFILDCYQLKENNDVLQKDYSAFVTWRLSHFNLLRLQYRYNDLDRGEGSYGRDYSEFIFQWSIVMGSHAHGLNW